MNKKNTISKSNDTALKLKILAKEKESVRRKLVVTAKEKERVRNKLVVTAKTLATTAKERESVRRRLEVTAKTLATKAKQLIVTAKEKENIRQKLVVTAKTLATTAKDKESVRRRLKVLAEEKENIRERLLVTAKEKEHVRNRLAVTAKQLVVTAKEKESVRQKLAVTAEELALKAKQLIVTAKEKESVRRRLEVTAKTLATKAKQLIVTAKEKESVRRKLAVTAGKLVVTAKEKESVRRRLETTAKALASTAKDKESVRRRLKVLAEEKENIRERLLVTAKTLAKTAKEKESVRRRLEVTAKTLATKAKQLIVTAKEKESVRRRLAVTASKLVVTAKEKESVRRKLVVTAKEKESVRRKLAVTAEELKGSRATLEKKVIERTKNLDQIRAKDEAMLASIGDGLAMVDKEGKIIYINKSFEEMLGWKTQEVIDRSMVEIIPREDKGGKRVLFKESILTQVLSGEKFIADLTNPFYYIRKDKSRFPVSSIVTPVVLNGKIIGAVETFRDITKEREIDKAKTEFVSLASHQLRTPLTTISWYTEMILKGDAGEVVPSQKKYLEQIYEGNTRMVELVNTLLNVSRIELGTLLSEPKLTDILAVAKSVLDEQKPNIEKKKLTVIDNLSLDVPMLLTDPKLLRMVFQNLLANAVTYTPPEGRIEFSISLENAETVRIQVKDTGYGIPKNQKEQIFTKLFRADNVRDKDTNGSGLGLYIVKSIVENAGGKIWFESEENKGSTFYVTLPSGKAKKV